MAHNKLCFDIKISGNYVKKRGIVRQIYEENFTRD